MNQKISRDLVVGLVDWNNRCGDFEKSCDHNAGAESHYQTAQVLLQMFYALESANFKNAELEKKVLEFRSALMEIAETGTSHELVSEPDGELWYERRTDVAEIAYRALEKFNP